MAQQYKRILLKLSGESLMGEQHYGIDVNHLNEYAQQIKAALESGVEIGIVIGGGNICRPDKRDCRARHRNRYCDRRRKYFPGIERSFAWIRSGERRPNGYVGYGYQQFGIEFGTRIGRAEGSGLYRSAYASHRRTLQPGPRHRIARTGRNRHYLGRNGKSVLYDRYCFGLAGYRGRGRCYA